MMNGLRQGWSCLTGVSRRVRRVVGMEQGGRRVDSGGARDETRYIGDLVGSVNLKVGRGWFCLFGVLVRGKADWSCGDWWSEEVAVGAGGSLLKGRVCWGRGAWGGIRLIGGVSRVRLSSRGVHDDDVVGLCAGGGPVCHGSAWACFAFAFGFAFWIERLHGAETIDSCQGVGVVFWMRADVLDVGVCMPDALI